MPSSQDRLISLIDFAQQVVKFTASPVSSIAQHKQFALDEHQIIERPGVHLNAPTPEDEPELLLRVDRLHETRPPELSTPQLLAWVIQSVNPGDPPKLKTSNDGATLISVGTHCDGAAQPRSDKAYRNDSQISL
jgi:hypothetical protein